MKHLKSDTNLVGLVAKIAKSLNHSGVTKALESVRAPQLTPELKSIEAQFKMYPVQMREVVDQFAKQMTPFKDMNLQFLSNIKIPHFENPTPGQFSASAGQERINYTSNFESSDFPKEVNVYLREGQTLNIKMRKPTDLS